MKKRSSIEVQSAAFKVLNLTGGKPIGDLKPAQYDILGDDLETVKESQRISLQAWAKYCKDSKEFGFTGKETLAYAFNRLKGIVTKSTLYEWAHKTLPDDSFATTKPKNGSTKIPIPESSKRERSLSQKQLQRLQQEQGRPGKTNQGVEEFEIEKLYDYDLDYLRDVVQWLCKSHEEIYQTAIKKDDSAKNTLESQQKVVMLLKKENERLKKENAELKEKNEMLFQTTKKDMRMT